MTIALTSTLPHYGTQMVTTMVLATQMYPSDNAANPADMCPTMAIATTPRVQPSLAPLKPATELTTIVTTASMKQTQAAVRPITTTGTGTGTETAQTRNACVQPLETTMSPATTIATIQTEMRDQVKTHGSVLIVVMGTMIMTAMAPRTSVTTVLEVVEASYVQCQLDGMAEHHHVEIQVHG